jgi:hypothetical protein
MKKRADISDKQQPRGSAQPAQVATISAAVTLSEALMDWFARPLHQLPAELQRRVRTEFDIPLHQLPPELRPKVRTEASGSLWDSFTEEQRRSWCEQTDRQRFFDEACVDWIYWGTLKTLTATEFCMLRHVQDPRTFEDDKNSIPGGKGKTLGELVSDDLRIIERSMGEAAVVPRKLNEWIAYAEAQGWNIPPFMRAHAAPAPSPQVAERTPDLPPFVAGAADCAVYRTMLNLTADEVSIAFVGDKGESGLGANNMLEIFARNETRRVALAAIGLVDRRRGTLNSQCAILSGMARNENLPHSGRNAAKMKRLRQVFRTHLGILDDPFDPYRKGGWKPRFKIADKRGALDVRAKLDAERRIESYKDSGQHGFQDDNTSKDNLPVASEENDGGDKGGEWLKKHDPDWAS